MTAKLRIKVKGIEIEWEGEVDYLKNDLPDLIAAIVAALGISPGDDEDEEGAGSNGSADQGSGSAAKFTTAALAAKTAPKNANELFKAALAKLQLSDGIEPASRAQVLAEMKLAPKFYKQAMSKNLSAIINALLTAGDINEPATGQYTLTDKSQREIESKI